MLVSTLVTESGETLKHYIANEPFEVDGLVYLPPEFQYSNRSIEVIKPYMHSAPMVEPKAVHYDSCQFCEGTKPDQLIIIE